MKNGIILAAFMAALCASAETVKTATHPWVRSYVATNHTDITGKADATNVYTKAETDARIVALSPAPGNYATVSNRAMTAIQEHQSLWPAVAASTNYTDATLGAFAATGAVARAETYGTPTRWTDATGCVWEATADKAPWTGGPSSPLLWSDNHGGWISNPSTDLLTWDSGTWSLASGALTTTFTCSGEWGAMHLVLHSGGDGTVILERGLLTNLVGRVALTNDIPAVPAETDPTVPSWAKAPSKPTYTASEVGATDGETVTNIVREVSLGGIWDQELGVWWTPIMQNGALRYVATTNVNLNAGN